MGIAFWSSFLSLPDFVINVDRRSSELMTGLQSMKVTSLKVLFRPTFNLSCFPLLVFLFEVSDNSELFSSLSRILFLQKLLLSFFNSPCASPKRYLREFAFFISISQRGCEQMKKNEHSLLI